MLPLLKQLAVGAVTRPDILATARGVAHAAVVVRGASLVALPVVPVLSSGLCPQDDGELVGEPGEGVAVVCTHARAHV